MCEKSPTETVLEAIRAHSGMEDEQILEAAIHGADAGWPGFTYYRDTSAFYRKNAEDIWRILCMDAENMGYPNVFAFMAEFREAKGVEDRVTFENLLSWDALERAGQWLEVVED